MAKGTTYEKTARLMNEAAGNSQPLKPLLKENCPWIADQLRETAKYPKFLGSWGRSLNYDEHANALIVEPPILKLLGELAGVPMRGRIVHAGVMHTFGYLFSVIETPFGKKRDRWVEPDLEKGLGLQTPTLRDRPASGSLLLNLTYFLAQLAFRNEAVLLDRLLVHPHAIAPAAWDYPFEELVIRRIVEQVTIAEGRRRGTEIEIHTDFIALPHPPRKPDAENTLLVYSVVNGARIGPQLITAFTVTEDFVREATSPANQGNDVEIRTRYNAYVEGLTGRSLPGRRFMES